MRVNIPSGDVLIRKLRERFAARDGFALATLNVDHLVKLQHSPAYRKTYAAQDLVVADGNPIVWLSHVAGKPVQLLPGSDMVMPIAKLAGEMGVTVALVGSTDEALTEASRVLRKDIPGIRIVDCIAPPMGFDPAGPEADALFARLERAGAQLVFIALGAPKQETLAALGRRALPHVGFVSVGAAIDFIAGHQKRAPALFRKLAMEWVWRAMTSPRRLVPRYLRCIAILPGQFLAAWQQADAAPSRINLAKAQRSFVFDDRRTPTLETPGVELDGSNHLWEFRKGHEGSELH